VNSDISDVKVFADGDVGWKIEVRPNSRETETLFDCIDQFVALFCETQKQ
jgi:hypothetical protein